MRPEMRGCPRPYLQAVEESVIDVRIRGLVDALNIDGVCSTWASCEGHGRIRCHKSPYVLLDTSVDFAGALSLMLEQEAVHEHSRLGHSWNISGVFMRGHLRFRMAPEQDLLGFFALCAQAVGAGFQDVNGAGSGSHSALAT